MFRAGLDTVVAVRASHVRSTHVLRLSTTDEAMSQIGIIDRVLREQIPPKVLLIAHRFLRGIWTRVPHMPYVAWETTLTHRFSDRTISRIAHGRHDIAIKLANASQLVTRDCEPRK